MSANANSTTAFTTKLRKFDGSGYRPQMYLEVKDVWATAHEDSPTSLQLKTENISQADFPLAQRQRSLH
ncbi:hypothetical protein PHPALM_31071 [Phytophthora palmivora]|uniref:Uncharacterized protein n=1 Tax=Phytophthora palmivora TaxID=4796 RepID=A0A2P4X3J6_9STRA|nr:hypothetical protein PHPALM_31071 [Phytophthora palmivora]